MRLKVDPDLRCYNQIYFDMLHTTSTERLEADVIRLYNEVIDLRKLISTKIYTLEMAEQELECRI
jgi:hypothetical protein